MPYEPRRFHKLSTDKVAQNTLWFHCAFARYGFKTKSQILFKIFAFLSMLRIEMKVS